MGNDLIYANSVQLSYLSVNQHDKDVSALCMRVCVCVCHKWNTDRKEERERVEQIGDNRSQSITKRRTGMDKVVAAAEVVTVP